MRYAQSEALREKMRVFPWLASAESLLTVMIPCSTVVL